MSIDRLLRLRFLYSFPALICLLFASFSANAQGKVDLEVKAQPGSKTARGGETFSYAITVTNIGTTKAKEVILITEPSDSNRLMTIVRGISSKGTCEIEEHPYPAKLRCLIGNLEPDEIVTIPVEAKIAEFGGEYETEAQRASSKKFTEAFARFGGFSDGVKENPAGSSLGNIDVSAAEPEDDRQNNRTEVFAHLLPSKNIPPRIEIVSPKSTSPVVKPLNKKIDVPVRVKAFDVDGTIRKVTVSLSYYVPWRLYLEDDGTFRYLFEGKKYTNEELMQLQQKGWEGLIEREKAGTLIYPENHANLISKDTYQYVLKDYGYGENTARICAYDDGGRSECTSTRFNVKSDSEIKIASPINKVLPPNSTVTIKSISKVNPGINAKVILYGLNGETSYQDSSPLMTQISRSGNTVIHRFLWKPKNEGPYYLRTRLYENGEHTETEDAVGIIIAEPRVIKITSIQNGQECLSTNPCRIEVYARDSKGKVINDNLEILVDGKSFNPIHSSDCEFCGPKSVSLNRAGLEKGTHIVQIVAKHDRETESGRSELYTVTIK